MSWLAVCCTMSDMTVPDGPASPGLPPWRQPSALKLPLPEARIQLGTLITVGNGLMADATSLPSKSEINLYLESFKQRVQGWRDHCQAWLDKNLDGQAAGEYRTASTHRYIGEPHKWAARYWCEVLQKEIESEVSVLESIATRLPMWVPSNEADRLTPAQPVSTKPSKEGAQVIAAPVADRKAVMVIYGHDEEANNAMFTWLRTIGLKPKEWGQLIQFTGNASPYIGQVLEEAFQHVQAVVALFTPDERVHPVGHSGPWRLQARPNVLIEAGMALVTHPTRTIIVVLGHQELPTDLAGRHYIQLNRTAGALNDIANRLEAAGCEIDKSGKDWLDPTHFPDRDSISTRPSP